jgi:hypothetical protein
MDVTIHFIHGMLFTNIQLDESAMISPRALVHLLERLSIEELEAR